MLSTQLYKEIKPFTFYTLKQFQYQKLLSRSKSTVCLYRHFQSGFFCVVKQVAVANTEVLRVITHLRSPNIVHVFGAALQQSLNPNLILFMDKCECNLVELISKKRQQLKPFKRQDIADILFQMVTVLDKMQKAGISHRDIKPENILYSKGKYILCDFDDALLLDKLPKQIDITTVSYSSFGLLKRFLNKQTEKQSPFDPFKLDVFALGLTLLYCMSQGKLNLRDRVDCCREDQSNAHEQYAEELITRYISSQAEFQCFEDIIKDMLEVDQYKRDDFVILATKIKNFNFIGNKPESEVTSRSSAALFKKNQKKNKKRKKQNHNHKYTILSLCAMIVFILLCLF